MNGKKITVICVTAFVIGCLPFAAMKLFSASPKNTEYIPIEERHPELFTTTESRREVTVVPETQPVTKSITEFESPDISEPFSKDNIKKRVIKGIGDPYLYCYIEVPEDTLYNLDAVLLREFYSEVPEEAEYFMIIAGQDGIFVKNPTINAAHGNDLIMYYGEMSAAGDLNLNGSYALIYLKDGVFEITDGDYHSECKSLSKDILDMIKQN